MISSDLLSDHLSLKCILLSLLSTRTERDRQISTRQTERSPSARTSECAQKVAGRLGSFAEDANWHDSELASKIGVRRAYRRTVQVADQKLEETAG